MRAVAVLSRLTSSLLIALVIGLAGAATPAIATPLITQRDLQIDLGPYRLARRTANRTRFDPAVHGFRFANTFTNNFIPEVDWRTRGLCGGMVFAALDYFHHSHIPLPTQDYAPADGTQLRDYIYARQTHSFIAGGNFVRWAEYGVNPFGARNAEFYRWGLEGRLDELRREIDAGRPVAIGLKGCNESCQGDHQVLAIGYDVGGYNGDPSSSSAQTIRIYIYDPNFPGQTMTMTPYMAASAWWYTRPDSEGVRHRWRSWFIQAYSPAPPPHITQAPRELILRIGTGGDDLRGTHDNLNILVTTRTGQILTFTNVNRSHPWVNDSSQDVSLPLPEGVLPQDVRSVRFQIGGGGDNWNLDSVSIYGVEGGSLRLYFVAEGAPLVRFTGEHREERFVF